MNKQIFHSFVAITFFKLLLDTAYFFIASHTNDYVRFSEISFNAAKYFESFVLFVLVFAAMPKQRRLSNVMIWLLLVISYVPMLTLYAFMDKPRDYMYAVTLFWFLVFGLMAIMPKFKAVFLNPRQSESIYYAIFIALSAVSISLVVIYLGISFNFDLNEVYNIREVFVQTKVPLGAYFLGWLAYAANPLFFAVAVKKKNWVFAMAIILSQIIAFSATGNKTYIFALPFVAALLFISKRKNMFFWMCLSLGAIVLAGIAVYIAGNEWIYFLFTRRVLFAPAQVSFFYYDFFSTHQLLFLSDHAFFSNLFPYPYNLPPGQLIGDLYFGHPETDVTTGIYADAFSNFGFIGLALWGAALSFLLTIADSFSQRKDFSLCLAVIAMPTLTLVESGLLTTMLSHGFIFAILLLYLVPCDDRIAVST